MLRGFCVSSMRVGLLWITALWACVIPVAAAPTNPTASWSFESGPDHWQPRADTVRLMHVTATGAVSNSQGFLHISGAMATGWNYGLSAPFPLETGKLYRCSAWVRVTALGSNTPSPYLKCEFVGEGSTANPGQVHTDAYDTKHLGAWQELTVEFAVPAGARHGWLALEKGTRQPTSLEADLDEITVGTIDRLSVFDQFALTPLPASLEQVRGVHPRLYLDAQQVVALREAITSTHSNLWRELREQADRAVKRGPPAYRRDDGWSGDEQLWQREVGNTMPTLALAYLLSNDTNYLNSARDWALASCAYPTWGWGRVDGMDLAACHQLFGLGIVYDWCYQGLGEAARQRIRETLARRAQAMFEAAATGQAWWRRSYLQNHLWVDACGLAGAGLALFDENKDANLWIGFSLDKFRKTMVALGPDGASHEGVGYWEYGVEYLLKFMDLARQQLDVNLFENDWWRRTASYPIYMGLPRLAWTRSNCIVDIADCPRGHWYGPDHLLRALAREYREGHAQWLAQEIDRADVAASSAPWLNLLWYDPTVPALSLGTLPTLHHFDDMEIVSARSGWSGNESLVVFKCGPFIGHQGIQEFSYDPGGGHVHPDANHFVVFGTGEWLIRDDGYRAKWTGQHNTLLVDGEGQMGEGKQWFDGSEPLAVKAQPRITRVYSSRTLDHIVGDAAAAYPARLGVQRFQRHLLFLKPDVLLVIDDIQLTEPRALELRFHPESREFKRQGRAFLFPGQHAVLRLEALTPATADIDAAALPATGRHGERNQTMFAVRLRTQAAQWRTAVALSWAPADQAPTKVAFQPTKNVWRFQAGTDTCELDWASGKATLSALTSSTAERPLSTAHSPSR